MRTVEPLALSSLPRVASSMTNLGRASWRWIGWWHDGASVALPGVGPVRLSWDGFEATEPSSRETLFLVGRDGRRGQVVLDRWLALTLVAAALGSRPPGVFRRLGPAERGVLAGLLATSLAQLKCDTMVSLDEPGISSPSMPVVGLGLRAETSGSSGRVRLDLPVEWLSIGAPSPQQAPMFRARLGRLPIPVSVELAATIMEVGEWASARCGDSVLFEGHPFPTVDEAVVLRVGDHAGDAVLDSAGAMIFAGPFRVVPPRAAIDTVASASRPSRERERQLELGEEQEGPGVMSLPSNDQKTDPQNVNVLGAAPIEVVAEIGRLTLRGDEILGLQRGSVLSFGRRDPSVNLLVGGQPWARGELVNIDGELGVRITELLPV
jgi:type III secretion system YscQ/HrcQ family protein